MYQEHWCAHSLLILSGIDSTSHRYVIDVIRFTVESLHSFHELPTHEPPQTDF